LAAILHLLTKKDARASSASFFVRICLFQILFDRGDGGTRTLVQTSN